MPFDTTQLNEIDSRICKFVQVACRQADKYPQEETVVNNLKDKLGITIHNTTEALRHYNVHAE